MLHIKLVKETSLSFVLHELIDGQDVEVCLAPQANAGACLHHGVYHMHGTRLHIPILGELIAIG